MKVIYYEKKEEKFQIYKNTFLIFCISNWLVSIRTELATEEDHQHTQSKPETIVEWDVIAPLEIEEGLV